jgi:hypothetical protein
MKLISQTILAFFSHIIIVAILGLIGMFVWNVGIVGIAPSFRTITFLTSSAIMLGIYTLNLFANIWLNKIRAYKKEKELLEKLFGKKK